VSCKNLPFADGVFFRVETNVATAFKTNAISVIRGLNKHDQQKHAYPEHQLTAVY